VGNEQGLPFQFGPTTGVPIGTPGYMPIEYAAYLGTLPPPDGSSSSGPSAGQIASGVGTGLTLAGAAATAAGVGGGAATAAGIAGAAATALAALGPIPGAYIKSQWARHTIATLTASQGDRVLAVNVYQAPDGQGWLAAAVEVSRRDAEIIAHDARAGLDAMYGEQVTACSPTHRTRRVASCRRGGGVRGRLARTLSRVSREPARVS
jgi:hypothetical protein